MFSIRYINFACKILDPPVKFWTRALLNGDLRRSMHYEWDIRYVVLKSRKIDKWVTIAHLTSKGNFTLRR